MLTLMSIVQISDVQASGSLAGRLVLESPLLAGLIGAAVGVLGWQVARSMGRGRLGWALAAAGVGLGAAIAGLGLMVETDRERIEARTRRFVESAVAGDVATVERLVSPRVALRSGGETVAHDRAWFLEVVSEMPGVITENRVRPKGARIDAGVGTSRFGAGTTITSSAYGSGRVGTVWELRWRRDTEGEWRIVEVDCLSLLGRKPNAEWVRWGNEIRR